MANYAPFVIRIETGEPVSIIHTKYTKLDTPHSMRTISLVDEYSKDHKFIKGIFISRKPISISKEGRGGNFEYIVQLDDLEDFKSKIPCSLDAGTCEDFNLEGNILKFYVSPRSFYFKSVNPPPERITKPSLTPIHVSLTSAPVQASESVPPELDQSSLSELVPDPKPKKQSLFGKFTSLFNRKGKEKGKNGNGVHTGGEIKLKKTKKQNKKQNKMDQKLKKIKSKKITKKQK